MGYAVSDEMCKHFGQSMVCPFCHERVLLCPVAERDRFRSALEVAKEALERFEKLPCQTCRRDADARRALSRMETGK